MLKVVSAWVAACTTGVHSRNECAISRSTSITEERMFINSGADSTQCTPNSTVIRYQVVDYALIFLNLHKLEFSIKTVQAELRKELTFVIIYIHMYVRSEVLPRPRHTAVNHPRHPF